MRDPALQATLDPSALPCGPEQGAHAAAPDGKAGAASDVPVYRDTLASRPLADGLEPGALVAGRYRLVERIGKGGMAEVWRATHEELRTDVAVKFLAAELVGDPEVAPLALERFRFEAQVSARISEKTRHVVSAHDAGTHRGVPYLAMELIHGHDLEQELERGGPLEPQRVATLLDQVADALDAAHAMGIVHRDIKPSNILLVSTASGEPFAKVADFGVAKATRAGGAFDLPRATMHGMLIGSPSFMSPEQADGKNDIRGASDMWSLGAVVYEALTGKPCFHGNSLTEVFIAVATRKFVPMSKLRPSLGKALDQWLDRCLAPEPGERFQTVAEMSRAFRQALPRAAAVGPVPSLPGLRAAVLVVPVLVLAALGVGIHLWTSSQEAGSAPVETSSPVSSSPAPIPPPALVPASAQPDVTPSGAPAPATPPAATADPTGSPATSKVSSTGHAATAAPPAGSARASSAVASSAVATPAVATPAVTTRPSAPAATPAPTTPSKTIDPGEIH